MATPKMESDIAEMLRDLEGAANWDATQAMEYDADGSGKALSFFARVVGRFNNEKTAKDLKKILNKVGYELRLSAAT